MKQNPLIIKPKKTYLFTATPTAKYDSWKSFFSKFSAWIDTDLKENRIIDLWGGSGVTLKIKDVNAVKIIFEKIF